MSLFRDRFAGRTAVVTGGASGLGLLTAKRMMEEGGRVSLWDINSDTLAEAKSALGNVHTQMVNIADHAAVAGAAAGANKALGKIDILVNSAGITGATVPVQ